MIWYKYLEAKAAADAIGGIVYKTSRYHFRVARDYESLAGKVLCEFEKPRGTPRDQCIYEIISHEQITYADLDLKRKDCSSMSKKLETDKSQMAIQYMDLLE